MDIKMQHKAPLYEALEKFRRLRVVPFDVPGHKRGRGNPQLVDFLGQNCVEIDVNSMKPLDNLCHPVSVIKEAEDLAADAFGAAHAFFMVGGTTSAVQSMVFTACKQGDKIKEGLEDAKATSEYTAWQASFGEDTINNATVKNDKNYKSLVKDIEKESKQ